MLGILLFLVEGSQVIGLSQTSATNTAFITGLGVLMVPFWGKLLFRYKLHVPDYIAISLGLFGLWLITGGIGTLNVGDVWVFVCSIACSFYIIYVDKYLRIKKSNVLVISMQQFITCGFIAIVLSLFFNFSFEIKSTAALEVLILLTIFPTLIAYFSEIWSQRFVKPIFSSFLLALEPVFAGIFAWVLGGEIMTVLIFVGGFLVFSGTVVSGISNHIQEKYLVK